MICPNCHKEFPEDAKFCDVCGTPLVAQPQPEPEAVPQPEPQAQQIPQPAEQFVPQQDTYAQPEQVQPPVQTAYAPQPEPMPNQWVGQTEQPVQWEGQPAPAPKKSKKKFFIIGGIAAGVAAIAVAVVLIVMNLGGGSRSDYALYLKDGEICYTDFSEKGGMELTDRLFSSGKPSSDEMAYLGSTLSYRVAFSADGKRVFYCDRGDTGSEFTLYFRDLSKPKIEPMKLDSGVQWSFAINSAGSEVFYRKADGSLYRHNLVDKEKIASDTYDDFAVADDCTKVLYAANYSYDYGTYDIYLWHADGEKTKLASDVSSLISVKPDFSTIYYLREGSIYRQVEGAEDREKLASDVYSVICGNSDGQIYFTREDKSDHTLAEFVIDDMAGTDAIIESPEYPTYPDYPEYPSWWEYDDDETYSAAVDQWNLDYEAYQTECERLDNAYYEAVEMYDAKQDREYLRESLANETVTLSNYTLCYFDGTAETELCDGYGSWWSASDEQPVVTFYREDTEDTARFYLSEITSSGDVWNAVMYPESSREYMIAVGASVSTIEEGNSFTVADDGSCVYYFTSIEGSDSYDLWRMPITDGVLGGAEKRDSDVAVSGSGFVGDAFVYYKNMGDNDSGYYGDLYIDGVLADYDVRMWSVALGKDGAYYYYTDYNSERGMGTLKRYSNGEKVKIADDVRQYTVNEKGDVLYLYDFSQNSYVGTLYRFSGGEWAKIDDDVSAIIPVLSNADKRFEMPEE